MEDVRTYDEGVQEKGEPNATTSVLTRRDHVKTRRHRPMGVETEVMPCEARGRRPPAPEVGREA